MYHFIIDVCRLSKYIRYVQHFRKCDMIFNKMNSFVQLKRQ